ncbi:MAG: hypothetical protein ACYC8S_01100 [Minisyncoccota bacterium]
MSSENPKVPAVGSLLTVRNCVDPYTYLALVVNQDAGIRDQMKKIIDAKIV